MLGFGIFVTATAYVIILFRIRLEVRKGKISKNGGTALAAAFFVSLTSIAASSMLTTSADLPIRFGVLAVCIVIVGVTYKFARTPPPTDPQS